MHLDVLIATYNRAELLDRSLASLLAAHIPEGLAIGITVIDSACTDGTGAVVGRYRSAHPNLVHYIREPQGGKSRALNAGIAATDGELIGMIDDDEEVDVGWFVQVYEAFRQEEVDFIGGPYIPRWGAEPPQWLPEGYLGALGWAEGGAAARRYSDGFPGILKGGNAVIRRRVLERVGPFAAELGPTPEFRLMSCEDEDMYLRLLTAGAKGVYLPGLIVYHYIGPERLTRSYFRRWCFWRGVSQGLRNRRARAPVPHVAGVPRWIVGAAARAVWRRATWISGGARSASRRFAEELALWDLAGFLYGRHLYRARQAES